MRAHVDGYDFLAAEQWARQVADDAFRSPAFVVWTAIDTLVAKRLKPTPARIIAWFEDESAGTIDADDRPDVSAIRELLECVAAITPTVPIGRCVELINAAAAADPAHNRIDIDLWRSHLAGHSSVDGDEGPIEIGKFQTVPLTGDGATVVPYTVEGLLPERQNMVIGGPPKVLKTGTALELAVSVASGTDFYGNPAFRVTKPGPVLLHSAESGAGTIRETFARICRAKGLDLVEVERAGVTLVTTVPDFRSPTDIADFELLLQQTGAQVAIIDPLYKCMGGASGSVLNNAGEQLGPIAEAAERCGVTLVLVHHTKRSERPGSLDLCSLTGAGVAEFARSWLLLDPRAPFDIKSGRHRLRMVVGGSAGHSSEWRLNIREGLQSDPGGRVWETTIRPAAEAPRGDATPGCVAGDSAAVVAFLTAHPGPHTKTAIRESLKVSGARITAAVDSLVTNGVLRACRLSVCGKRRNGVELATNDAGSGAAA